jgi:hypothetical protein
MQHQLIAFAAHGSLQIGGIAGGHIGLGHGKGRAHVPLQQGLQPLCPLFWRGKAVQQLHIAGVGRAAVEHLGGPGQAPHDFGQRGVVQVA